MTEELPSEVDRLISVGLDAIGSFDPSALDTEYTAREDTGVAVYDEPVGDVNHVGNEHYLG